jgi:hypothetical protein
MVNYIVKKTTELSEIEIEEIASIFKEIFNKERDKLVFMEEYQNTIWGFSLHGLMIDNGNIAGTHNMIPVSYRNNGEPVTWMFSADTMVRKAYRNFFNIAKLVEICESVAKKEYNIDFIFGFPNNNSYPIFSKGLGYKYIGRLNTYILPYRIGGINSKYRSLNFLSVIFSKALLYLSYLQCGKTNHYYKVDKNRNDFYNTRLKWFNGNYEIVKDKEIVFVYKTSLFDGIRTAFLIDINNVSKKNINKSIRYILSKEYKNIDAIIYVGNLPFIPLSMIKIPQKYEPKNFYLIGKYLNNDLINKEIILDINNWNINLSCYDLL